MNDKEKLLVIKYLANTIKRQYSWGDAASYSQLRLPDNIGETLEIKNITQIEMHFNNDIEKKFNMLCDIERIVDSIIELSHEDYRNE